MITWNLSIALRKNLKIVRDHGPWPWQHHCTLCNFIWTVLHLSSLNYLIRQSFLTGVIIARTTSYPTKPTQVLRPTWWWTTHPAIAILWVHSAFKLRRAFLNYLLAARIPLGHRHMAPLVSVHPLPQRVHSHLCHRLLWVKGSTCCNKIPKF
jgi:hypothetical protein